ncbi:TPA: hypothetical protein ACK3Q6_005449 [Burkholderia cepacia]|uniref:hypothetical protein n=1 Tax=Burkholderia cepacia TaxID=292 RepID=UPI001CF31F52|nr:hypothetical protein [Burkholderia cepacia]MCA8355880.1 hypothetical protein [Burkholderia cepacia]HDR9757486.1 hypothetical protein [Burkholderia cepacia ATCC 25416]HDV6369776.1 hypothetical protein [Burkholderia cepacia]
MYDVSSEESDLGHLQILDRRVCATFRYESLRRFVIELAQRLVLEPENRTLDIARDISGRAKHAKRFAQKALDRQATPLRCVIDIHQ